MDFETQNQHLSTEYRSALERYEQSVAFWNVNPIAYTVGPGQRVPATNLEVLLESGRWGTPDETCREAMASLDRSRDFRRAHGKA